MSWGVWGSERAINRRGGKGEAIPFYMSVHNAVWKKTRRDECLFSLLPCPFFHSYIHHEWKPTSPSCYTTVIPLYINLSFSKAKYSCVNNFWGIKIMRIHQPPSWLIWKGTISWLRWPLKKKGKWLQGAHKMFSLLAFTNVDATFWLQNAFLCYQFFSVSAWSSVK